MAKSKKPAVERRDFLKGTIAGAAAIALSGEKVEAESAPVKTARRSLRLPPLPEADRSPAEVGGSNAMRTGSDFMADVIKSLPFDFVCANPGDKFSGIQESLTGPYGGNKNPEWITCMHEETSVGMGHGYYKIEGKPVLVCAHGTVGLQHAAMAIYNAYCDRVPVFLIVGNSLDNPGNHTVEDAPAMVRDFIRWDATPTSLKAFAESVVRAYGFAMTPPMMPVVISADAETQEGPIAAGPEPLIPKLTLPHPPAGDSGSVAEAARLLAQAQNPVVIVDKYARTQAGTDRLVELAELLQSPVLDEYGRMNFPTRHPLYHSFARERGSLVANADVILGLEVSSLYGTVRASKAKVVTIGADGLLTKGNYEDIGRYQAADLAIAADAETTMFPLIEAVKGQITSNQRVAAQARGTKLASIQQKTLDQARTDATYAWDASPVSTGRLNAELWEAVKGEDWSFVSYIMHFSYWPLRTWPMEKHYHYNGQTGGNGMGYNAPAALGAALANKKYGRFTVNIQGDGDLMYAPGALWTAAHHKIPILNVVHNNRCYHQELMALQNVSCRMNRGLENVRIGVGIDNPNIDYAKLASAMGVYSEGPITDPKDLGPALKRAVAVVKRGEPALVDVVSQPR
jgi:acetolactate synthase-1/2/3 large subunit